MNIKQLTYPTSTVISLAVAKAHLRVTSNDEDILINDSIKAATSFIEKYTGQLLLSRTFCAYLDEKEISSYGIISIWGNYPITAITAVKYLNSSGVETTLDSSTYSTDITDSPARILLTSTPSTQINTLNTWRVYFTAGYTEVSEIDQEIIAWLKIFTAFYYNSRQPEYTGISVNEMAIKYERQLDKFRKDLLI